MIRLLHDHGVLLEVDRADQVDGMNDDECGCCEVLGCLESWALLLRSWTAMAGHLCISLVNMADLRPVHPDCWNRFY